MRYPTWTLLRDAGIFLVISLASFALFATPSADASHFSGATGATGCTDLNRGDAANPKQYFYNNLTAADSNAMDWTRGNNLNPTNINTSQIFTLTASTDVNVLDGAYTDYCGVQWVTTTTGGVVGITTCDTLSGSACKRHSLRMSTVFTSNSTTTTVRGLACHENGHAVGLGHRSVHDSDGELVFSCMHSGYPKNANAYDSHDVSAINSHY